MNHNCSVETLLKNNPAFQKVQSWYDESVEWFDIDMDLMAYRDAHDKSADWYPDDDEDKEAFLSFVAHKNEVADKQYKKRLSRANNESLRSSVEVYEDMLKLGYNRAQLESRIDLIKSEFDNQVRTLQEFEKGEGRERSIEETIRWKGYRYFVNRVFNKLEKIATPDKEYDYYVRRFGQPKNDERKEQIKKYCEYSASEIKKLIENKEIFAALAASAIGDAYGLSIDVRGSEISLKVINDLNDEADAKAEDQGNNGGDRYRDIRVEKIMETLSPETKAFIATIPQTDNKGNIQYNDLLRIKYLDPKQIAYILPDIARFSTPDSFIADIEQASGRYPYLINLARKLKGEYSETDSDYAAMVYSNFKRAANTYGYIDINKGAYRADKPNTRAHGNAIVRSMSVNVHGVILDPQRSFYDNGGRIRNGIKGIRDHVVEELDDIKTRLGAVNMAAGGKDSRKPFKADGTPTNYKEYTEYSQYAQQHGGEEAMLKFLQENSDVVPTITRALHGIGIDVTEFQVRNAILSPINKTTLKIMGGHRGINDYYLGLNRLDVIVNNIESVYNTASSETAKDSGALKYSVATDVFNAVSSELVKLNAALGVSFFDELEPRVLIDGSSLQTYIYPSLIHDTMDLLNNEAGEDPNAWWDKIKDEFLQYVGYAKHDYYNGEDHITPIGWFKRLDPNRERKGTGAYDMIKAGDMKLVHMTTFNHVEYQSLSIPQKIAAQLVMWARDNAVEVPIQADYTNAWDFIQNAGIEHSVESGDLDKLVDDRYNDWYADYLATHGGKMPKTTEMQEAYNRFKSELSEGFGTIKKANGEYHTEWPIVQELADEVEMEINRILDVDMREFDDHNGLKGPIMKTYLEHGKRFQIFPEMNDTGFMHKYMTTSSDVEKRDMLEETIAKELEKIIDKDFEYLEKTGALTNPMLQRIRFGQRGDEKNLYSTDGTVDGLQDPMAKITLQNFFLDYFYGRMQMTKILSGGLENYNGLLDFEKRNMMQHATRRAIYTNATWNGQEVGRKNENAIYLMDEESESFYYKDFSEMFDVLKNKGLITPNQFNRMTETYNNITTTDGQAFRCYDSYRVVQIELGKWNPGRERVYNYLMHGKGFVSKEELQKEMQEIYNPNEKPVYTGWEIVNNVKTPVLHKYSEMVLFPPKVLTKLMGDNVPSQLMGMSLAAERLSTKERPIDIFLMLSCVKVGGHTIIDPFAYVTEEYEDKDGNIKTRVFRDDDGKPIRKCQSANEIANYIEASVKTQPWAVHELPMKYYGEAASTPAHGEDDEISWSSQADKDIWGNIQDGDLLDIDAMDMRMKSSFARDINDEVDAATAAAKYKELQALFDDPQELKDVLLTELASKSYASPELKFAIENDDVPYFYPSIARGAEQLFSSIIKKRMTRPRTKGANLLQVTSLGYDVDPFGESYGVSDLHKLKIEFDGKGESKRIKWVDCYMPIHDSRLEIFADENGNITPEMLWGYDDSRGKHHAGLVERGIIPEEMLKFIAYRTPSDEMHSILPLRIKGFTSKARGANIIVPKEVMAMTGHDFDGDKFRCHFLDFQIVTNDSQIYEEYKKQIGDEDNVILAILNNDSTNEKNDLAIQSWKQFKREYLKDPKNYTEGMIRVYQYDYTRPAWEQTQKQRDNAKVQLAFAQLTSPAGSRRMIIPGGSAETDVFGAVFEITRALHGNEELKKTISEMGVDVSDDVKTYNSLIKKSCKELAKILDAVNGNVTPYTFAHSNEAFDYMIGGKKMISVYALYASAGQMLQRLNPTVTPLVYYNKKTGKTTEYHIGFFNKEITGQELYKIENNSGQLGTLTESEFINSAVDNGKNPRLGYLNQVPELAELTNWLVAANLSAEQVHLILNQPVVVEAVRMKRNQKLSMGKALEMAMSELTNRISGKEISLKNASKFIMNLGHDEYVKMMVMDYSKLGTSTDNYSEAESQIALARVLINQNRYANLLARFIKNTRPEATTSGIGSTLAGTMVLTNELDALRKELIGSELSEEGEDEAKIDIDKERIDEEMQNKELISGLSGVIAPVRINDNDSEQEIADKIAKNSKLKRVTAFEALMQDKIYDMMFKYFPQAKAQWRAAINNIANKYSASKREKEAIIRSIGNEMILWNLLKSPDFTVNEHEDGHELIVNMPDRLRKLKERISREKNLESKGEPAQDKAARYLVNNIFLEKLTVHEPDSPSARPHIAFQRGGVTMDNFAQKIAYDWAMMYAAEDEETHQLAVDLFKYNAFTSGFGFGMYEFAHFAPFTVLTGVGENKGYLRALQSIRDNTLFTDTKKDAINFLNQYYMNHWGDERLVKHYTSNELPNVIRTKIGLSELDERTDSRNIKRFGSFDFRYIVVDTKEEKKLYRVLLEDNEQDVTVEEAQKLGHRTRHGQVFVQYEPHTDYDKVEPHQVGEDSLWEMPTENFERNSQAADISNDPMSKDEREDYVDNIGENQTPKISSHYGKDQENGSHSAEGFLAKASAARDANAKAKPVDAPTVTEAANAVVDAESKLARFGEHIDEDAAPDLPPGFGFNSVPVEGEMGPGESSVTMPYLERSDDGREHFALKHLPWTPNNVRKAREIASYVALNKKLREEIFPQFGITTTALTNADVRLHRLGAVAWENTTKINAAGLREMIRIAEGQRGEEALPEEFAHLALEMLGFNHPLVQRLFNVLSTNTRALKEAFDGQYDEYLEYYKGNMDYMVKEAAGKLLSRAFLREMPIETPETKPLIRRIVDKIKELFRSIGSWRIWNAILDANQVSSKLARDILSGRILDDMSFANISGTQEYAQIQKNVSERKTVIHGILQREVKRLALLQKRHGPVKDDEKSPSVIATEKQIALLENAIRNHKVESALYDYMQSSLDFLKNTEASLDELVASGAKVNSVCRELNTVRDTLYSYASVMDLIEGAVESGEIVLSDSLSATKKDVKDEIDKFFNKYNNLGMRFFERMLANVYGEHGVTRTLGKHKGEQLTISEMARKGERDISLMSRMLSSLADCGDYVLAAFDDITRRAKMDGRNRASKAHERIVAAFDKLESATGSKDQTFMFAYERGDDRKMHKTGKYLDEETARKTLSDAQLAFYNEMMDIKKDIDSCLPPVLIKSNTQIVALRKYGMDRVKNAEGIHGKLSAFGENVKNAILDTSDEADSEDRTVKVDFQGNKIDNLPIKYTTKSKNENWDDMTDDVALSMAAYASMGYEYDELNNVIAMLENARYMSQNRDIEQSAGRQKLVERWKTGKTEDDYYFEQEFTKKQMYTNLQRALDDFFQMHLYGKLQKEEGGLFGTKISKRKAANMINAAASYTQMAFNLQQRISNVGAGAMNIAIETAGKGVFNAADFAWAMKEYFLHTPKRMMQTGAHESTDKLSLFAERYDLHQNNGKIKDSFTKSRLSRVFNTNLLFLGLNAGEDMLALTTALAVARNFKVKGPDSKVGTFFDAFDVKYLDDTNKTGAHLEIKPGYTMEDGSEITKEVEQKYAKLVIGTNFRLQGIYNSDDKSAIQQYAFGSLVMMYRKWMHPALVRRYGKAGYNPLTGEEGEGYWRTFANWIGDSMKDALTDEDGEKVAFNLINYTKNVVASARFNWENMTDYEKTNIHRAMFEFSALMSVCLALMLYSKFGPDKDKSKRVAKQDEAFKGWFTNMAVYQLFRIRNEMGSVAPTPLMLREIRNTLASPVAGFDALLKILQIPTLLWPGMWTNEIKSGPFKGHSSGYKLLFSLPILSLYKQVNHVIDPTPLINYYKNSKN